MKVCFIENNEYLGSSSTAYYEYSQAVAKLGFDVSVISASTEARRIEYCKVGEVRCIVVPVASRKKKDLIESTRFGRIAVKELKFAPE